MTPILFVARGQKKKKNTVPIEAKGKTNVRRSRKLQPGRGIRKRFDYRFAYEEARAGSPARHKSLFNRDVPTQTQVVFRTHLYIIIVLRVYTYT